MRVLFWNTHNNVEINPVLSDIILENDINLVLLAEYQADANELITNLQQQGCLMKKCLGCNRLTVLSDINELEPGTQDEYWNCQEKCSQRIPKICNRQVSGGMVSQPG